MREGMSYDPVALHRNARPGHLACRDLATGRAWSYAELDAAIRRTVTVLAGTHGVARGQRVAALARNSVELLLLQQATLRMGAIFVPLNWRLAAPECRRILQDCAPTLLVVDPAVAPDGVADCRVETVAALAAAIAAAAPAGPLPPVPADLPCLILYTSGTSGVPKGVMLTGANLFFTAVNFGVVGQVSEASVFLCDAPMFHVIGMVTSVQSPLLRGATVLVAPGFDPQVTNDGLADPALGVTHYFCVPQMAEALRQAPNFRPEAWRLKALFTGGAPNPPANIRGWLKRGIRMVDGFGMTETGTTIGMPIDTALIDAKAGSVGLVAPATRVRIVDPGGEDVADGAVGEILVAGPNVSPGYWGRPEEQAVAFTADGWLRTGDLGCRDVDGFVFVVGRRKDMFISGGENVYPVEVEAVLAEHPAVEDVAVIGIADLRWGEVGRAYVVLRPDQEADPAELHDHCAARLARYKIPKEFRIVAALPRTATGKIVKQRLRDEARAEAAGAGGII
ncbi:Long-chain-fatty-acid--CoA ligase [Rhodovastum atsumiense]|uniref:3-methylmercaptopropionyl-CoA ligase n=1 Tax=Rhodovastum atsumiense TaxID=504468 RepID=A0A5M6IXP5_9PROT|nr:AMP-binding protein [Rhodovastum atsumiense]KAA5612125.1 AMP-binding protein [Rhodovastum atsumiense]CAH2603933.1 Long-chain-fatty-acid--CoA ligase [Rhodovastum atsumiense]